MNNQDLLKIRRMNFPEILSENIVLSNNIIYDNQRNCDLFNETTNKIIEVKCTSGICPISFSPKFNKDKELYVLYYFDATSVAGNIKIIYQFTIILTIVSKEVFGSHSKILFAFE